MYMRISYWKVESSDLLGTNPNLRVGADGLVNTFDPSGLRIVQWDCDWENAQIAGVYPSGGGQGTDPTFVVNGFAGGMLNFTQNAVNIGACAIFGIAANGD